MALTKSQKLKIESYWLADESKTQIAKRVGVVYNTVSNYINKLEKKTTNKNEINEKNEKLQKDIRDEVIEIKEEQNRKLIETIINDDRMTKAADLILDILTDEDTLRAELTKGGIRGLTGLLGMITDKGLKYADLEIKKKQGKDGYNVHIDNNIGKIVDLMSEATETHVDPIEEIKEFKEENND